MVSSTGLWRTDWKRLRDAGRARRVRWAAPLLREGAFGKGVIVTPSFAASRNDVDLSATEVGLVADHNGDVGLGGGRRAAEVGGGVAGAEETNPCAEAVEGFGLDATRDDHEGRSDVGVSTGRRGSVELT